MPLLKKIFLVAMFLNLAFPRTGFYIHQFPLTIPNILLGLVCLAWFVRRVYCKSYPRGILDWLGFCYLAYVFFMAIGGLVLGEKMKAVVGLGILGGYGVLFFVTLDLLKGQRDILLFSKLVIISLILTVSYGILQIFLDLDALVLPGLTELSGSPREAVVIFKDGWHQVMAGPAATKNIMWGGGRKIVRLIIGHKIFSTFHHGNLFGCHLAIFILFILNLAAVQPSPKKIWLLLFLIVAMVILIFTTSRGAFLALCIGLVSLLFYGPGFRVFLLGLGLLFISSLIFINLISLAVFYEYKITSVDPAIYLCHNFEVRYLELGQKMFFFWQAKFKKDAGQVQSRVAGYELDGLANRRFSYWREAIKNVFSQRPLRALLWGNGFRTTSIYRVFNFYLWMIFQIGLVGFALFSLFLGYILITSFRSLNSINILGVKAIAKGGVAGLIAALSHNLVDNPFYYPPLLANFWILAGLIVVIRRDLTRRI